MGRKRNPALILKQIEVAIEDVEGCFPGPIIARGNSYYLRLDASFMRFWALKTGDEILVQVSKVKRLKLTGSQRVQE